MSIQAVSGLRAYTSALANFNKAEQAAKAQTLKKDTAPGSAFTDVLKDSLGTVNDLQKQKNAMIESFASGETQNVHELMISLQRAGLAVSMTSAVRNKVMEAYRELSRIQF
jgi:flagellar hook-basal body complex protein FliE